MALIWNDVAARQARKKAESKGVKWVLDHFTWSSGNVSGSGWCTVGGKDVHTLRLVCHFSDGSREFFPIESGGYRHDVLKAGLSHSGNCGFFFHGALQSTALPVAIELEMGLPSGEAVCVPVPYYSPDSNLDTRRFLIGHYIKRFVMHLCAGNWRLIVDRIKAYLPTFFSKNIREDDFQKLFLDIPNGSILVIDHVLGGGANHYRNELVQGYLATAQVVVVWTFVPMSMTFQLHLYRPGEKISTFKVERQSWYPFLDSGKFSEVVFNNCVSFPEPVLVAEMLLAVKKRTKAKLKLLLHDFFMVCPSHFLLNDQKKYCGAPERSVCQECLPAIKDGLVSLFRARDIEFWRARWGEVLYSADEIVCFSKSTQNIYLKIYPQLSARVDENRMILRPHRLDYVSGTYQYPLHAPVFRVAVVGTIDFHKGRDVLLSLVHHAAAQAIKIEFVIIGTLSAKFKPSGVIETGPYQRHELASLLVKHRIHMGLMLSIWPETFSYVTHELITLGVPVFSFDLGAQGDAVRSYHLGMVLPLCEGEVLLPALIAFKANLDTQFSTLLQSISFRADD